MIKEAKTYLSEIAFVIFISMLITTFIGVGYANRKLYQMQKEIVCLQNSGCCLELKGVTIKKAAQSRWKNKTSDYQPNYTYKCIRCGRVVVKDSRSLSAEECINIIDVLFCPIQHKPILQSYYNHILDN
ncbi:MAG: hypothetical protein PHG53_09740 [Phycisphaerae bacterium]|nr:hypothetical protein [Phycisphaerae bacterium]